jgi:flavin reductase (DIM6/NTAB) family NADH-FMN oxidoreductase RutF
VRSPSTWSLRSSPGDDGEAYRQLARRWPASVTVVTTLRDGAPDGFTATAVLMVSIAPPIVLVSATRESSAWEMLGAAERFAVNLLHSDQRALAEGFATPHERRGDLWRGLAPTRDAQGIPLLPGSLGAFSARVRERVDAGDHVLVLGDVTEIHLGDDGPTLLYGNRAYGTLRTEEDR